MMPVLVGQLPACHEKMWTCLFTFREIGSHIKSLKLLGFFQGHPSRTGCLSLVSSCNIRRMNMVHPEGVGELEAWHVRV